jgi:hypothetical protein
VASWKATAIGSGVVGGESGSRHAQA